jgi:hypothetical protein
MKQPLALRLLPPLGLAAIFGAVLVRKVGDFDLPWHIASGKLIVETHSIPRVDDLAYTHRPVEHIDLLSDVPFYAIHHWFGALGLQLLTAALSVGTAFVLWTTAKRAGPAAWISVALAMGAMSAWLLARPATIGFLFLALVMMLISRHREEAAEAARSRSALYALPPLLFLWANTHPSVFLGVAIVLGYAGYRALCRFARGRAGALLPKEDGNEAGITAALAAATVAASLVNPGFTKVMLGPLRAEADFHLVAEWAKPTLSFLTTVEPATGLLLLVALLALVFGTGPKGKVPNAFDLGVVLLAFVLSRTAVRLLAVGAIMLAPFIARRFAAFVRPTALMQACAGASLLVVAPVMLVNSDVSLGIGFEETHYPESAVLWIKQNKPAGHMYNFMAFGGYLAMRLHPDYRVLIDGRQAFVHGHVLAEKVEKADVDPAALSELVAEQQIEWAITRSRENENFGTTLARSRELVMVYFDDVAAIYAKQDGPNAELARAGYRAFRHLTPLEVPLRDALTGRRSEAWSHDGALAVRQAPKSPRAHFVEACAAIALGDRARFDRAVGRIAQLAPSAGTMIAVLQGAWNERSAPRQP